MKNGGNRGFNEALGVFGSGFSGVYGLGLSGSFNFNDLRGNGSVGGGGYYRDVVS